MFACEGVDFVILKPSKILENVNEKLLILGFSNQNIFEPRAKNFRECTWEAIDFVNLKPRHFALQVKNVRECTWEGIDF